MENYIFHFNEAFSDTSSEMYNEPQLQSGLDSDDFANEFMIINSNLQLPNQQALDQQNA